MMKKFNLTVTFILGVVLAPGLLFAASEVVIGYANISARVSPLWIARQSSTADHQAVGPARAFGEKIGLTRDLVSHGAVQ